MTDYKDFDGPNPGIRIALLRERTTFSTGGTFAAMAMGFSGFATVLALLLDTSAVRQAAEGAMGAAAICLFGICALIGRKRVYIVYREPPPGSGGSG
jgi:hypothetical protein